MKKNELSPGIINAIEREHNKSEIILFFKKYNLSENKFKFKIGIGCEYSDMIFGAIGDESRLEFTVIGETVNIASKYEKLNKKLNTVCLTSKQTYETAIRDGFIPKLNWTDFTDQKVDGTNGITNLMGISNE